MFNGQSVNDQEEEEEIEERMNEEQFLKELAMIIKFNQSSRALSGPGSIPGGRISSLASN